MEPVTESQPKPAEQEGAPSLAARSPELSLREQSGARSSELSTGERSGGPGVGSEEGPDTSELDVTASERSVRLKFGGRTARHIFRRLHFDDWNEYVKASRMEIVLDGDTWTHVSKTDEAAIALWDKAILHVEGYKVGPQGLSKDWKRKMPARHKIVAVGLLQEVTAVPSNEDADFDLDLEADRRTVVLEASWNERVYPRLLHTFRVPAQEETLRYRRIMAESYRKPGRRKLSTRVLVPPRLASLVALYDALIVSTSGYRNNPSPREMDALHKQAAAMALFNPPSNLDMEEGDESR